MTLRSVNRTFFPYRFQFFAYWSVQHLQTEPYAKMTSAGLEPSITTLKGWCPHHLDHGARTFFLILTSRKNANKNETRFYLGGCLHRWYSIYLVGLYTPYQFSLGQRGVIYVGIKRNYQATAS